MLKQILMFLPLVLVFSAPPISEDFKERIQVPPEEKFNDIDYCNKNATVEDYYINRMFAEERFPDQRPLKCSTDCLRKKLYLFKDGKVDVEALQNLYGLKYEEFFAKIAEQCFPGNELDDCLRTYELVKCTYWKINDNI